MASFPKGEPEMAATKADMQRLKEQRDRLLVELEALKNKVAGIEMAMALLENGAHGVPAITHPTLRPLNAKGYVLDLLSEVGTIGLSASTTVEIAARRGVRLDRQSVSSLLSRLKKDKIVIHEGGKYRLLQFIPKTAPHPKAAENRPQLRAVSG
jgi:hypothetical protein